VKARSILLVLSTITFLVGCGRPDLSADKVVVRSEKASPIGEFVATSFYCEGGGAAGYAYENVSLRRAGEDLDQRDGLLGKHKTWKGFSDITIRWIDDSNLEISYKQDASPAYGEHVSERVDSKYGIKIHYIATD